ncbi:MAG: chemotaxis protein CheD [Candidatus Nealsonbacteria bacterium]|nr:chemotaxis protein CheD [Candidatus Nealsonbacteria bacterium]
MSITCNKPKTIRVPMGGLKFAEPPDVLETLLGSCVGIAIWDERSGCGGLAHAVLPDSQGKVASPGKFVDTAVLHLKQQLVEQGASEYSLRAKVAGGSIMFGKGTETIGTRNCEAALHHLKQQNIRVVAEHLGGDKGRVIRFSLKDQSVEVEMGRKIIGVI